MKIKKVTLAIILAVALLCGCIATVAVNGVLKSPEPKQYKNTYERLLAEDGFIYGIVQPWSTAAPGFSSSNGSDFGDNQFLGTVCDFDPKVMENTLRDCKTMGLNCIKIWLAKTGGGLDYDSYGNVTVQPKLLKNLKTYLQLAREIDIAVCVTMFPHIDYSLNNRSHDDWNVATQFYLDEQKREGTMQNVVIPICNVIKEYEDTVAMVELFCEPEGDVNDFPSEYAAPYGTTWDNMIGFIRTAGDTVHSVLPNMPVTVASGHGSFQNLENGIFNKMNLDIIGNDVYNDDGELADLEDLKLNAPCILGEFGGSTKSDWDDGLQASIITSFFKNAKEKGYVGAFSWHYGFACTGLEPTLTLVNPDGDLRGAAASIRFLTLDNKYARTGKTPVMDTPAFLTGDDITNIRFIGSRTAVKYELYRSENKKNWTKLGSYDAEDIDVNGFFICKVSDPDATVGKDYYYKVKAISDENDTVESEPSQKYHIYPVTCSPEKNLMKNTDFSGGTYEFTNKNGFTSDCPNDWTLWNNIKDTKYEVVTTDTYNGGKYALRCSCEESGDAIVQSGIKLESNKTYTLTFYSKSEYLEEDTGDYKPSFFMTSWPPEGEKRLCKTQNLKVDGEWHRYTIDIKTGDNDVSGGGTFCLYCGGGVTTSYADFYLFEKPKAE